MNQKVIVKCFGLLLFDYHISWVNVAHYATWVNAIWEDTYQLLIGKLSK